MSDDIDLSIKTNYSPEQLEYEKELAETMPFLLQTIVDAIHENLPRPDGEKPLLCLMAFNRDAAHHTHFITNAKPTDVAESIAELAERLRTDQTQTFHEQVKQET